MKIHCSLLRLYPDLCVRFCLSIYVQISEFSTGLFPGQNLSSRFAPKYYGQWGTISDKPGNPAISPFFPALSVIKLIVISSSLKLDLLFFRCCHTRIHRGLSKPASPPVRVIHSLCRKEGQSSPYWGW